MRTQRGRRAWAVALGMAGSGLIATIGSTGDAQAGPAADTAFIEQPAADVATVPDGVCFAEIRVSGDPGAPQAPDRTSGVGGTGATVSVVVPVNSGDTVTALTFRGGLAGSDRDGNAGGNVGGDGHGVQVSGATYTSYVVAGGGGGAGDGINARSAANGGNAGEPAGFGEAPGTDGADGVYVAQQGARAGLGGLGGPPGSGGLASAGTPPSGGPNPPVLPTDGGDGLPFADGAGGTGGDGGNATFGMPGGFPGGGGGGGWTGGGGGGGSILIGNSDSGAGGGGSSYVSDQWGGVTNDPRDEGTVGNEAPSNGWDSSIRFVPCDYDLKVEKRLLSEVPLVAGALAEYAITVTNVGQHPMAMSGDTVVIRDEDLSKVDPFVTEFVPIEPATDVTYAPAPGAAVFGLSDGWPGDGTRCAAGDIAVGIECGPLGVGDSYTVHVRQVISNFHPNTLEHCNAASIDGDRNGNRTNDSTPEVCAPVVSYDVTTSKTVAERTLAGTEAEWTITVSNDGPADMEGPNDSDDARNPGWYSLTVTDPLLVVATSVELPEECSNNGDGTLGCDPLNAGGTYDITVRTPTDRSAAAGAGVSNTACAGTTAFYDYWATLGDTDLVNDVDEAGNDNNACTEVRTELVPGDLGIDIETAPIYTIGEPITWTITVTNHTGLPYSLPQSVTNPFLQGLLGATVEMPPGCEEQGPGEWTCNDPLGVDESMTFIVTTPTTGGAPAALLADSADPSTALQSCAQVADSATNPAEAPDADCAVTVARAATHETTTTTTTTTVPDPPTSSSTTAPEATTSSVIDKVASTTGATTTTGAPGSTTNAPKETTSTTADAGSGSGPGSTTTPQPVEVLGASTVVPESVVMGSTQIHSPASRTGTSIGLPLAAAAILLTIGLIALGMNRRKNR